ncbi:four-carbon acid sugar kinase family protein [bacterium]
MNNNNKQILVIADDLTGCGDTAYWVLDKGLSVSIFDLDKLLSLDFIKTDVLIVNANTRNLTPHKAYLINKSLCIWAKDKNIDFIFKKIDSTLRGNFALESDALVEIFDLDSLPLLAAYPEYDRKTINGYHYINDVLLENTHFAKDPKHPIKSSYIPDIIKRSSKFYDKFLIYNAETERDVEQVVNEVILRASKIRVFVGTSKFFGEILNKLYGDIDRKKFNKKFKNIIIAAGSCNPVTKMQLDFVYRFFKTKIIESAEKFVINKKNNIYIIESARERKEDYLLDKLCAQVKNMIKSAVDPLVVFCGGDTSYEICKNIGVKQIDVLDKVDTGIILGRDKYTNIHLLFKSGGFGPENFLKKVFDKYASL